MSEKLEILSIQRYFLEHPSAIQKLRGRFGTGKFFLRDTLAEQKEERQTTLIVDEFSSFLDAEQERKDRELRSEVRRIFRGVMQ